MSKQHARGLAAFLAAALAATIGVTGASAATTWTVRPGGTISLTSGLFTVKDIPTGSTLICASSALSGTLKRGSGHPGTGIGSITTVSIRECGNLGMFTLTPGDLPWRLNLTSYNATTRTVTGSISHVHVNVSGEQCSAVVDGTSGTAGNGIVKFTYADSTAKLKVLTTGGNLHFHNVNGCAGLVRNGDPATLSTKFTVSPKQAITSP
jgi:hypothetical protein